MENQMDKASQNEGGEVTFKPLTDGLGFHPFSNGMPYTPQKISQKNLAQPKTISAPTASSFSPHLKNTYTPSIPTVTGVTTGAGAVAAGKPQFIFPKTTVPLTPIPKFETKNEEVLLFKRVYAYLIDLCLNTLLITFALTLVLWKNPISREILDSNVLFVTALFLFFVNWALITAQEIVFKTSFGKRLFSLFILDEKKGRPSPYRIFFRSVLFLFSLCCMGFGILWALFDSKKRAWHDLATGTEIIREVS